MSKFQLDFLQFESRPFLKIFFPLKHFFNPQIQVPRGMLSVTWLLVFVPPPRDLYLFYNVGTVSGFGIINGNDLFIIINNNIIFRVFTLVSFNQMSFSTGVESTKRKSEISKIELIFMCGFE